MPTNPLKDQLLVSVASVIWVVGTVVGMGTFGSSGGVQEQGRGLFSDHATLIAPHGPAFSIWSVIYLGLAGYVVWQWLPSSGHSSLARVTRRPAAAAIALNGLWLLVVFVGWVWVSVAVMIGIVVALKVLLHRASGLPRGWPGRLWVGATFGLYLGWICVATCANIASALVGSGVPVSTPASSWLTVGVLALVALLLALLLWRTDDPWARAGLATAVVWGTSWIAVGRFTGELRSDLIGGAALGVAVTVAALGLWSLRPSRLDRLARPPA